MQEAAGVDTAIAAVRAAAVHFDTLDEDRLLGLGESIETLGRMVDALRVGFAGEVEHRSRPSLAGEGLAFRRDARDGVELVQRLARIDRGEAKRRVGLGAATRPVLGLDGSLLPGRHGAVHDALAAGTIGVESARLIVNVAKTIRRRVTSEQLDTVVTALIDSATTADTETLHEVATYWVGAVDPDGAEPRHRDQQRKRSLKIGRTGLDGMTRMSLLVTPEHLAMFKELFDSRRRGGVTLTEAGGDETGEDLGPEWRIDDRTRIQHDYDTLTETVDAGARAEHVGATATGTAVTHEVVVQITADELEKRDGQGWTAGVPVGIALPAVERRICTGGTRILVTGDHGEPLHLTHAVRLFTPAQKKALTLTAGGRCQYPGCRTPAPYLEAHHVAWHGRDHGATDVDNGVMLCSYHHHLVHAKHSPVELVTDRGVHHLVPAGWVGPPGPEHRLRTGTVSPAPPPPAPDDPWQRPAA